MRRIGSATGAAPATRNFTLAAEPAFRRILLFVAPPGCVSEAMAAAIEREFAWITVRHVPEPTLACASFDSDVQLILVDARLLRSFKAQWDRIKCAHPSAVAALLASAPFDHTEELIQITDRDAFHDVLPTEVNLDIWLAVIGIILKGGEYFPPALLRRSHSRESVDQGATAIDRYQPAAAGEQWNQVMDGLTERELEVLAIVARGNQNKIIAADLGLSEHTVKIHLHNIIRKLGVHNRTEAAAMYFKFNGNRGEAEHAAAKAEHGRDRENG